MADELKPINEKKESIVEQVKNKIVAAKPLEVKKEEAIELSREYVVPLRAGFKKAQKYRRAKKAVLVLKTFLAKHMKVADRDLRLVKLDNYLNQELWYRGIRNPIHKIKVKAVKKGGIVYAELAEIPEVVKFKMQKDQKVLNRVVPTEPKVVAKEEKPTTKDETEKEKATAEQGMKENKTQAKAQKHTPQTGHEKKVSPRRTVLQK